MAVTVGMRMPPSLFERDAGELRRVVALAEASGLDRLTVGDHVSFRGGQGFDGLLQAGAMAALATTLSVQTGVYLLGLRHPVPVARQVAGVAHMAPGRFVFGVGVGGEDRREWDLCGVDPSSRGARVDESLVLVRALLTGEPVTHHGRFFNVHEARILPPPPSPVPIVIGGRSPAALRRTAIHGDGWVALFVSAERFTDGLLEIERQAVANGRHHVPWRHAIHLWCSFDSNADQLARTMEHLYGVPFDRFARYSPYGSPAAVAAFVRPYLSAGCQHVNLGPVGAQIEEVVEGVAEVRRLLQDLEPSVN